MRVLVMDIKTMGLGWGEEDHHLPDQYKKIKNDTASGAWKKHKDLHMGPQSRWFDSHIRFRVMVYSSAHTSLHQKARFINAGVMGGVS